MNLRNDIRDHLPGILLNGIGMVLLFGYLLAIGVESGSAFLILIVWAGTALLWFGVGYWQRKRYFRSLEETFEALDQKYLIGEVAKSSYRLEDQIYFDLLRRSNKSMIEKVHEMEDQRLEYKEYIEGWIHEVKTPLSVLELMCAGKRTLDPGRIRLLVERLDRDVETALYYARADQVSQDYRIREISLQETVNSAVKRQKQLLIHNRMRVEVSCGEETVFCDEKWIEFMLGQMFSNAVKYKRNETGTIRIFACPRKESVELVVEDDGIGIKSQELRRVFEKGFTGSNGRQREHATGIGLYLCRRLSEKLGLAIRAESKEGAWTRIILTFPRGTYLSKL